LKTGLKLIDPAVTHWNNKANTSDLHKPCGHNICGDVVLLSYVFGSDAWWPLYIWDESKITKCQTTRRGGLPCKGRQIERNCRIQATG